MRLERPARRKPIGITSLIDVIFLLLLFFMLASSFSKYQATPLAAAGSGSANSTNPILLRIHNDVRWDMNGVSVTPELLGERLAATIDESATDEKAPVAIWTAHEAKTQDLVDALTIVREAGFEPVLVTGR